jgi:hypothetical protein
MTCGFSDVSMIEIPKHRYIKKFDEEQFIKDLICASEDGKEYITWYRESVVDRIIREKNLYKLGE